MAARRPKTPTRAPDGTGKQRERPESGREGEDACARAPVIITSRHDGESGRAVSLGFGRMLGNRGNRAWFSSIRTRTDGNQAQSRVSAEHNRPTRVGYRLPLRAVAVGMDRPEYGPIHTDRVFRIPAGSTETEAVRHLSTFRAARSAAAGARRSSPHPLGSRAAGATRPSARWIPASPWRDRSPSGDRPGA